MPAIITKECLNCKVEFETLLKYEKRGQGRFCSRNCSATYINKTRKPNRIENEIFWTEDIAYLIGIIASDGNLQKDRKRITITSKDEEIMNISSEMIKQKITGKTYKIVASKKGKSKWYNYRFTSNSFYDFSSSIGLKPNKSLIMDKLDIPKDHFHHFLRGVIDGDGTYTLKKNKRYINICIHSGSRPFLAWLKEQSRSIFGIEGGSILKNKKTYSLHFYHKDSLTIFSQIYKNPSYYLTRKFGIANTFLKNT